MRLKTHLDEKLAVFLDIFVRLFLLDFLLRLHRDVNVDAKLFVPVIVKQSQLRRGTMVVTVKVFFFNIFLSSNPAFMSQAISHQGFGLESRTTVVRLRLAVSGL